MGVTGTYVCHDYDDVGGRNEWHTVTITQLAPKSCIWRNTAGVAWALSATSDPLVWATGPDCCYYEDGHKAAKFTAKNGAVISVAGPGHESFVREHSIDLAETYNGQSFELAGSYECHAYDEGGKNDWHYVTIEQSETFTWKNKAGASWTLNRTDHPLILAVGEDCPYFEETKTALFTCKGGEVVSVAGPGNEPYLKKRYTHNCNSTAKDNEAPGTSTVDAGSAQHIPGTSTTHIPGFPGFPGTAAARTLLCCSLS